MGYEPTLMFTATRSERLFMKHLFLALLFLALEATGLRVAVAQDGNRDADPVRKIPPVRISISSLYQRWTQDGTSLREVSIPVTAQLRLRPNFSVSVGVSQAFVEGDDLEQVSGLTDVQLAFDYLVRFRNSRLVFNLGLNVPTGTSQLSDEAYETAFQLGLSQYDFQVPHFGQGASVAPGIALVTAVTRKLVVSIGASYRSRGSFEPIAGLPDTYEWGDEQLYTIGGAWQLGSTLSFSADAIYTRYEADKIGGVTVYEAGSRLTAQAQLHKNLRMHDLWLSVRYRTVDTNRVLTGGALRPEAIKAFPGLLKLSADYRVRLNPTLRATVHVEGTRYEADFAFEQLDVFGIGIAPDISLSPAVTIPLQVKYVFGDLEGLEAGLGVVAIL